MMEEEIILEQLKQKKQDDAPLFPDQRDAFERLDALIREAEGNVGFDLDAAIRRSRSPLKRAFHRRVAWFVRPLAEEQRHKNERYVELLRELANQVKKNAGRIEEVADKQETE